MRCPSCSTELPSDAVFCSRCGTSLANQPSTAAPADLMRNAQSKTAAAAEPEQPLWHGGFSPQAMYGSWLLAGLVTIFAGVASVLLPWPPTWLVALVVVGVLWLVLAVYYFKERLSADYTLTTQRLLHRRGILSQKTDRIEVIDIDDVQFTQGIVERMFGVGKIRVISSDRSDPDLILRGIGDVRRVADLIDNARREERRKRSLYMEKI
jgi:membrane protein YdbS with pleckstrin-like domain